MKKKVLALVLSLICCMPSGAVLTSVAEDSAPVIDYESSEYLEASRINDKIMNYMSGKGYRGISGVQYLDGAFCIVVASETREELSGVYQYCEQNGWISQISMQFHTLHAVQCLDFCSRIQNFIDEQNYPEEYAFSVQYHENEDYILVTCLNEEALGEVKDFYENLGYQWCETRFQTAPPEANIPEETAPLSGESEPGESTGVTVTAGDVNLDDSIDIFDVILLNKAILGKETLSYLQNKAADINHDDKIDASDSLTIMKLIVGLY